MHSPSAVLPLAREADLWEQFQCDRNQAAREELVRRHLPHANRLAARYRHGAEPLEDLQQVARLGLLNAVDRFDPERGISFRSFASPTILGELKRHFRDRSWTVRIPRGAHDVLAAAESAVEKLTVRLQRAPTISEIAEALEIDPGRVLDAYAADHNRRTLSLDRPVDSDDDETSALEWIGHSDGGYDLVEDRLAVESSLGELDQRERKVLHLRFVEDKVQSEIAATIGCSQMHVSRILRRALAKLREEVARESVTA
jgi:RNA polymerase sigma-B factor